MNTPHTVDMNVNGVCNLNCPWCWWPEHTKAIESMSEDDWVDLIDYLVSKGTQSLIFTGGEPLLKTALRRLLQHSLELGNRNTLSTNGILLRTNKDVLDLVHDVWIPLDWPNIETNQLMRVGTPIHFEKAIDSLLLIQEEFPTIDLTVRTVASAKNHQSISEIGRVLIERGVDPERLRWKIYQCSTSWPRRGSTITDGWLISDEEFAHLAKEVRKNNPQFTKTHFQAVEKSMKSRYLHIMPNGDVKVIQSDPNGNPIDIVIGRLKGEEIIKQFDRIIEQNSDIFTALSHNNTHG